MERFFAIETFLNACGLRNIVHLENDVLLYIELDKIIHAFNKACPAIGTTADSIAIDAYQALFILRIVMLFQG